jgi:hypothetical protein
MKKKKKIGNVLGMVRINKSDEKFGDVGKNFMEGYEEWRKDKMLKME